MLLSHDNAGFSLIEVMTSIVILGIGIFSLYSMQVSSINGNSKANLISTAANHGGDRVEQLMQLDYTDLIELDNCTACDNDGTNQDNNNDGVDDDGGNFGLDDVTAATADGSFTSADGVYSLFWNVAVDYPVKDSSTIRIYTQVNNSSVDNMVVMNYIKNANI